MRGKPQKTYWHLQGAKRAPDEYEIVSSRLLYYPGRGFEVDVPLKEWYRKYQQGSPFQCRDWEAFSDPCRTTYTAYTARQSRKEIYVDGLLEGMDGPVYAKRLSGEWLKLLERVLMPARYPWHGFQMAACYVGQMAPSGRVAMAAMFQAADETRRIQRVAYRLRQLQLQAPGFGEDGRAVWEKDPLWQGLREGVERLLTTYDWGEAFTALNLVLKPMMDGLLLSELAALAGRHDDPLLEQLLAALGEDSAWHRRWSGALARMVLEDNPEARKALAGWVERWRGPAERAAQAFAPAFEELPLRRARTHFPAVLSRIRKAWEDHLTESGVTPEGAPHAKDHPAAIADD